ncbi:hypothetical protein BS47DRAFT_1369640 [Hydnum rufescens UP504]|uniref:F-box domain-containing protein n=1 Tax=Hydnum rufescens UP504 TaxID=1448309 RepID=A0A9P6AC80_9AGAM|nr:hypothetical protein BS47DRAFT_1369640 [Hydnum rufescens UP504]
MIDILVNIFAWCGASTLAASARVTRCWEEAALGQLWREVDWDQTTPLFRVLWNGFMPSDITPPCRIHGNWERFSYYSPWVRKLALGVTSPGDINSERHLNCDLLNDANILAFAHSTALFPLLRSLTLDIHGTGALRTALLLLQPHIRQLTLTIHDASEEHIIMALKTILLQCPYLHDLALHLGYSDTDLGYGITMMCAEVGLLITSLTHLRSLRLPPNMLLNPILWSAAGAQPHLHSLQWISGDHEVQILDTPVLPPPLPPPKFGPEMFPHLRCLSLSAQFPSTSFLFSRPVAAPLKQVELTINGAIPAQDLEPFLESLGTNLPAVSDVSISCHVGPRRPCMIDIRPIFVHRMQRLHIQLDFSLNIDNRDLSELAQAVPNIVYLSLAPDPICSSAAVPPKITLDALKIFARFCPRLKPWRSSCNPRVVAQLSPRCHPILRHSTAARRHLGVQKEWEMAVSCMAVCRPLYKFIIQLQQEIKTPIPAVGSHHLVKDSQ